MKIFNQDKTKELSNIDLGLGYLVDDKILVYTTPAQEAVEEEYHYEYTEYPNGGRDRHKIIDVVGSPAIPETDVFEDVKVFIPYTTAELAEKRIAELKQKLFDTDYRAIKFAEGELTEEEYAPYREERRAWRKEINSLGG